MHRAPGTCVGIGPLKNARHLPVPGILKFSESPQNSGRQVSGATDKVLSPRFAHSWPMRGFNPIPARHVMMVYSDVEIELPAFIVPAANGSGQLQASVAGCTTMVSNWLWMDGWDVMQKKEARAHVGNATVTARTAKSYNLGAWCNGLGRANFRAWWPFTLPTLSVALTSMQLGWSVAQWLFPTDGTPRRHCVSGL